MRSGFKRLGASSPGVSLALALAALVALAGCKKTGDETLGRMTEFKNKMCACKDKGCIDQVTAEMAKWSADHRAAGEKASDEDQKKLTAISSELTACMTQVARDTAAAGSAAGSASGAAAGSDTAAAGAGGTEASGSASGSAVTASGGGSAGAPSAETMPHRAGMCPSTVLGATTKAAVKGKAVVLTIDAADKDAIAAIQKRADELLAEKRDAATGAGHDQKGTHGGTQGLCPVHVPEGAKVTAKHAAKGVVVTITPRGKPDELAREIDDRIARADEWVKANVKPGDQGNQGGVGGGKGKDGSNHSGKGDGKGRDRKGGGGGKGTGGGGGAGTGGGGGKPG